MGKDRNIIFIGHANPEDNEFTLWIQQKLINEGYKVECDLTILVGGENDYWKDIQECLENSSCKYLIVLSKKTFEKSGVLDEWEYVRSLIKNFELTDFIIPLKIDDVSFNTRIGLNRINIIDFSKSWALGLKHLINKLERDSILKIKVDSQLSLNEWFSNRWGVGQGLQEKEEIYYSNWLEIKNLPEKYYLFEYSNDTQAKFVSTQIAYPNIIHDKYIISFEDEINPQQFLNNPLIRKEDSVIEYKNKQEILISNITNSLEVDSFPKLQDSKNFLIRLLKDAFNRFLISNNLTCYYYEKIQSDDDSLNFYENEFYHSEVENKIVGDAQIEFPYKVKFPYQKKIKRKILLGKYFDSFWHLGISINVKLFPAYAFELKSHIVFSDDGKSIWDDKDKLHRARRYKGKRFFNEEWRDLLFAFLHSLKKNSEEINIPIKESLFISLSTIPINLNSKVGYKEPKNKARLIPINEYFEDDDEFDEENNIP
jgi:TIR domain